MEDSLEDYIRISNNLKDAGINQKVRADILITAQKKKECEVHAMKIVQLLIEGQMQPQVFLNCLKNINPELYQDIVDERAIVKQCGYAICSKKLPEMPKKQFHISVKANKVYDISERKNFCSNFCYKASEYVKNQLDSSPLWLRNQQNAPKYKLLPATTPGTPGELVDHGIAKPVLEPKFTSVSAFTQVTLQEVHNLEKTNTESEPEQFQKSKVSSDQNMSSIVEEEEDMYDEVEGSYKIGMVVKKSPVKPNTNEQEVVQKLTDLTIDAKTDTKVKKKRSLDEIISKHRAAQASNKKGIKTIDISEMMTNAPSTSTANKRSKIAESSRIENTTTGIDPEESSKKILESLRQWLTIDTFIYLHGEEKVKKTLDDKKLIEYFEKLKITELKTSQQIKYMEICKRLRMKELAEEQLDAKILNKTLKPLPDYKQLKEENKDLNVKVKSFYCGVVLEKPDSNFSSINKKAEEEEALEEGSPAVLPLVDASSQNAMRRKVFLTSIHRKLLAHLDCLQLDSSFALEQIQELVRTFKLSAKSVIFKPHVWNYVALALIKVISLRNDCFKTQLENKECVGYFNVTLGKMGNHQAFLNNLLQLVQDIDAFVEIFINGIE